MTSYDLTARQRYSREEKAAIVAEALRENSVSTVSRRHRMAAALLFRWKKEFAPTADAAPAGTRLGGPAASSLLCFRRTRPSSEGGNNCPTGRSTNAIVAGGIRAVGEVLNAKPTARSTNCWLTDDLREGGERVPRKKSWPRVETATDFAPRRVSLSGGGESRGSRLFEKVRFRGAPGTQPGSRARNKARHSR
ncbi:MAG: transposase [Parvularculaceae bacterium]|nr:transposase [Parvularculaceae bacterium]